MTGKQAKEKSLWCSVGRDVREYIEYAVEKGRLYVTLPNGMKLHNDDHLALQELGYYIYFNKATESHEIRW